MRLHIRRFPTAFEVSHLYSHGAGCIVQRCIQVEVPKVQSWSKATKHSLQRRSLHKTGSYGIQYGWYPNKPVHGTTLSRKKSSLGRQGPLRTDFVLYVPECCLYVSRCYTVHIGTAWRAKRCPLPESNERSCHRHL